MPKLSRRELLAGLGLPLFRAAGRAAARPTHPNFVFVLMDDLRWDEIRCAGHPLVETPNIDRLAAEGGMFQNAFVTTPLCSPSRASFLTGLYAHKHGIIDNTARDALSHRLDTFPRRLHDAGYETGFVGKWHMGLDDSPRPGFDSWVSFKGQGTYFDPDLNVDGNSEKVAGYTTDILTARAVAFLQRTRTRPFMLWLAHKAVHPELTQNADGSVNDPSGGKFVPAARHKSLYAGRPLPRRPNWGRAPQDKPALQRKLEGLPPLGPETGTRDEDIRNRWRMLAAVDEGIGKMCSALQRNGQLDNTVFIFTSDEGYFYGEHGLSFERRLAYEESIRIPLVIRYPGLIRPGSRFREFALNVDIAPTVLELAGLPPPDGVHGRSLLPVLRGKPGSWRRSLLVEHHSDRVFPRVEKMGYQCVRTARWKYIHYTDLSGMDELYDLEGDPYEMKNVIGNAAARNHLAEMQAELQSLLKATSAGATVGRRQ